MKIYFAGSIRGGREDKEIYLQIIEYLSEYGKVLTEHVGSQNINDFGESNLSDNQIYNRDISWLQEADVMIAEVSTPSLGVGYEIGKAEEMNKKILCLYRSQQEKKLSAMINGSSNLKVVEYNKTEDMRRAVDSFFKYNLD
jgi:2'-deoxynucleoside 5'-phosphate N-hydrolase